MNLRRALKIAMANKEIDQQQLSELSGVNKATLSATMNDKSSPSIKTVEKLAKVFDMPLSELIALGEE